MQWDKPSRGKTFSDIKCVASVSSIREQLHFCFYLHQNQLMAQHALVTKLQTVTRLLAVRIPVHREQKEPDIVALSWCSEASNISQRERESCICTSKCVCQPESSEESNVTPHKCCICFLWYEQNAVFCHWLCGKGWSLLQAARFIPSTLTQPDLLVLTRAELDPSWYED